MSAACRAATRCCICSKSVKTAGRVDAAEFDRGIRQAVLDIVKRQVDAGIDIVSDGETSKISYATYVHDRLTGFSDEGSTEGSKPHADLAPFPDLRRKMAQLSGARRFKRVACVGPIAVGNRQALAQRPRQYARRGRCRAAGRGIFDRGLSRRGRELSAEHLLSQPRRLHRGHRRGDAGRVRRHCRLRVLCCKSIAPIWQCRGIPAFRIFPNRSFCGAPPSTPKRVGGEGTAPARGLCGVNGLNRSSGNARTRVLRSSSSSGAECARRRRAASFTVAPMTKCLALAHDAKAATARLRG